MQHWETTFALEKQKHASALSMQKEELLQSCVEMVTREMEAYKHQVTANMIAMTQAASDELERDQNNMNSELTNWRSDCNNMNC